MTQEELDIWFQGCIKYYNSVTLFEQLPNLQFIKDLTDDQQIKLPQPKEVLVNGKEYLNEVEEVKLLTQFCWGVRLMNCYLIKLKNVEGNFTLNMATEKEQPQVRVGTFIRHYITGTKITQFKFIKI